MADSIALFRLPPGQFEVHYDVAPVLQDAADKGALAAVIVLDHPIKAVSAQNSNRPYHQQPLPIPALIASEADAEELLLLAAEKEPARLIIDGENRRTNAMNVIGKIDRGANRWLVKLIGSVCTDCGNYSFPREHGCSRCCGTSVKPVELECRGTLWSWTTQSFMPPSPPYHGSDESWETFKPFLLGMVELPGQCRVLGRLLLEKPEDIEIGMDMELTLFPYRDDTDGNMLLSYAFKPANT